MLPRGKVDPHIVLHQGKMLLMARTRARAREGDREPETRSTGRESHCDMLRLEDGFQPYDYGEDLLRGGGDMT